MSTIVYTDWQGAERERHRRKELTETAEQFVASGRATADEVHSVLGLGLAGRALAIELMGVYVTDIVFGARTIDACSNDEIVSAVDFLRASTNESREFLCRTNDIDNEK